MRQQQHSSARAPPGGGTRRGRLLHPRIGLPGIPGAGVRKDPAGEGVSFSNSFGASGDQSRAVVAGQPASVVHFAQAGDMERLVEEGELVAKDWDKQPYGGIAQDSVVVITVRKGNPKGIHSLDDVLSKDVDVVTPNPFSSGAARWNIMAVYGTQINEGKSPDQALEGGQDAARKGRWPSPVASLNRVEHSACGRWPHPSRTIFFASGMSEARASATRNGTTRSFRPQITSVGESVEPMTQVRPHREQWIDERRYRVTVRTRARPSEVGRDRSFECTAILDRHSAEELFGSRDHRRVELLRVILHDLPGLAVPRGVNQHQALDALRMRGRELAATQPPSELPITDVFVT